MKTVVLYGRRTVGMMALAYLKAFRCRVKVISEDENIKWMATQMGCDQIKIYHLPYHPHDLFICVHGDKIIPKEFLHDKMINIHPTKYNGHNPVKKYIENEDTDGCIRVLKMIEEVDAGELLHQENFETPICKTYADFYNIAMPNYFKAIDVCLKY